MYCLVQFVLIVCCPPFLFKIYVFVVYVFNEIHVIALVVLFSDGVEYGKRGYDAPWPEVLVFTIYLYIYIYIYI